jgi:hypothetical protein
MTLLYFFSKQQEQAARTDGGGIFGGASSDDVDDTEHHIFWANWKGLEKEGSSTSAYLVYSDQDCNTPGVGTCSGTLATPGSQDFYTFGGRHATSRGKMSYRGEFYYQAGKNGSLGVPGPGLGDLSAYMLGLRVGWKEVDIAMKPTITLWYDYLSGTSAGQTADGDTGQFNTLFDTGHKFYGFMDFIGSRASGFHDVAIKFKTQPYAKTTLKLDLHTFLEATQTAAGTCPTCSPNSTHTIGNELDLTAIYKYSASTTVSGGYSHFFAKDTLFGSGAGAVAQGQDSDWLYVMFDVKF